MENFGCDPLNLLIQSLSRIVFIYIYGTTEPKDAMGLGLTLPPSLLKGARVGEKKKKQEKKGESHNGSLQRVLKKEESESQESYCLSKVHSFTSMT